MLMQIEVVKASRYWTTHTVNYTLDIRTRVELLPLQGTKGNHDTF